MFTLFALSTMGPLWFLLLTVGIGAIGSWASTIQARIDAENYIGGAIAGSYNNALKIQQQFVTTGATGDQQTYVAGTPLQIPWTPVTVANMTMYMFTCDQGTAAYPVVLEFWGSASLSGTHVSINLIAGQTVYWDSTQVGTTAHVSAANLGVFSGDNSSGTVTGFGTTINSVSINIPSGLGLSSPGTVNLTGRIAA